MVKTIIQKRPTRYVYYQLASDNSMLTSKIMKWEEELSIEIEHDVFCYCFIYLYKVTNVPKFRSFQPVTQSNHNQQSIYSPNCSFCEEECETYLHLSIFCLHVTRL